MDNLPDQLLWDILSRIHSTIDRNSVSLACKRLYNIDNEQRKRLHVGCGVNPANEALTSLCYRFPNLNRLEITYFGCMSQSQKQLDDPTLSLLSVICPCLTDLTLNYCTFITDAGLSYLALCSGLSSLKLNFIPGITGSGLLPIASCCKNLKRFHLIYCSNISDLKWIGCLGMQEKLQDLCIKNCRGIGEGALVKLGPTWRNIKRLQLDLDLDPNRKYNMIFEMMMVSRWVPCDNMVDLTLTNCIISPGKGLACILDKCKNLVKIHLDMCIGARDCDIIALAQNSKNLRSVLIRVSMDNPVRLTDNSLMALAQNCLQLESVSLSLTDGEFSRSYSFSLVGILSLIKMCPVRNLFLDGVYCFNNIGMEALCGSDHLQTLELIRCEEVTDEGLGFVAFYPWLRVLRLTKCPGVTDDGFKSLVGSCKLEELAVNDCHRVSLSGVQGVAKHVSCNIAKSVLDGLSVSDC